MASPRSTAAAKELESVPLGSALVDLLVSAGVQTMYTVPGESFLGLLDAAAVHPALRLVSTRHESGAGFMAAGEARVTGRPALVAVTRAVGAANLSIAVHTAFQDSDPMVVLVAQADSGYLGRESFQEIDLGAFYGPITKSAVTVHRADRVLEAVARAVNLSVAGRPGPVMVAVPGDVLDELVRYTDIEPARRRLLEPPALGRPVDATVRHVVEALESAVRPVIIVGGGARDASDDVVALAEAYGAGVYCGFRRQDAFPNDHPLYLGHLGLGAPPECLTGLASADVVLVLGCRLSEVTTAGYTLPSEGARVIQVDADPTVLGSVVPTELGIVADVGVAVRAVLEMSAGPASARNWAAERETYLQTRALPATGRGVGGVDPARVIAAMIETVPPDAVVANDAGNFSTFLHRYWPYGVGRTEVAPTNGAMGYSVPAAIGAKLASPDRAVVAVVGDGGFTMTGFELETAVRENVDITVIVFCNGLQGTIAMHQARSMGRLSGVDISHIRVAELARSLGAQGWEVTDEAELVPALREALAHAGPAVVEVRTDPDLIHPTWRLSEILSGGEGR